MTENTTRESQIYGKFLAGLNLNSRVGLQTRNTFHTLAYMESMENANQTFFIHLEKNVSKTFKATF